MDIIRDIKERKEKWIQKYFWLIVVVWTIFIVSLFVYNLANLETLTHNLILKEARIHFQENKVFSVWAAKYGGFYVPTDSATPTNPYLTNIFERDIETPSGVKLTLMNPAYAQRKMLNEFHSNYGIGSHITSLKPLRSENAPDQWERKALEAFETGVPEVIEFKEFDSIPMLRYMKPLITIQSCLKCHASQGYKLGDIIGGISISIPLSDYITEKKSSVVQNSISIAILWLLGFLGLFQGYRVIVRKEAEKEHALSMLSESQHRQSMFLF